MMSRKRLTVILIGVFLSALSFQSCTTTSLYSKELPEASVFSLTDRVNILKVIGNPSTNPYIEPSTVLRGKLDEFYIVKIDFNLEKASRIDIVARMDLANGSPAAYPYDREQFLAYWEGFASHDLIEDNVEYVKKMNAIRNTCFPSYSFIQKSGRSILYLPFIGKNPIPRPAKVYVQVYMENGKLFEFTDEVEEPTVGSSGHK